MSLIREVNVGNRVIKFEFQKYAKQANGSVMVTSGGTQVLVTACAASKPAPGQDFFPLGVDFIEKLYAAGRIPGGYQKREGRPGNHEALTARVIDRPLRPSFPKDYQNETVINCTVMSYQHGYSAAPLALVGASTALMISDIPFNGPVAAVRLGLKDGEYIFDPKEGEESDLDLNIACKPDAVLMVEAGANFLSEEQMLDAIDHAHDLMKPLFEMQLEIRELIGKKKWDVTPKEMDSSVIDTVTNAAKDRILKAFSVKEKIERGKTLSELAANIISELNPENDEAKGSEIKAAFEDLKSNLMRRMILDEKKRIDERSPTEIRPITCETGVLIRPHGSSLFTRGETQALATVTLGSKDDAQRSENLYETDLRERFLLHYNFPPYSVGEARMQRSPGRREIGHGSLAHRALVPVLPSEDDFGYTIRVVSEILESNGSSSMATVCSGSMALMTAGVPIKEPVAGIAMGLVKEGEQYTILSDILGDEDHLGDMDFKVCGTKDGITALQMDIKISGLSKEILSEALAQAKEGRKHILEKMSGAITSAQDVSEYAPRIFKLKINQDKIRDLIGPGGKTIKKIVADTGVKLDIDDSGIVSLCAPDAISAEAAKSIVRSITTDPEIGQIILGKAVRIVDFGVFVELKPGCDGLCHISQLDTKRVEKVEDIVKEGDEILVKVIDIDRQGRVKLSRKDAIGQQPTA
ncbi:MAG: polyribonucleotide nucleotidyltransferase [Bdellovibrionota bacterium]